MVVGDRVFAVRFNPTILDRIIKREKEIKEMPAVFVKKSALPVLGRGKTTGPSVTIAEKGQISFNPAASKAFGDLKLMLLSWDAKSRECTMQAFSKPPKGFTEADMFVMGKTKKSGINYFSASALLQDADTAIGYDYKASGNQSFAATIDTEKHVVSFTIPSGKLQPKPKQERAKKAKTEKVATAGASNGGSAVVEEDDE